jgi:hypothetical protein
VKALKELRLRRRQKFHSDSRLPSVGSIFALESPIAAQIKHEKAFWAALLCSLRSVRLGYHIIEDDKSPPSFSKGVEIAIEAKPHAIKAFAEPWVLAVDRSVFGSNQVMVTEGEKCRQVGVIFPNLQKSVDESLGCRKIELRRFVCKVAVHVVFLAPGRSVRDLLESEIAGARAH